MGRLGTHAESMQYSLLPLGGSAPLSLQSSWGASQRVHKGHATVVMPTSHLKVGKVLPALSSPLSHIIIARERLRSPEGQGSEWAFRCYPPNLGSQTRL